MTCRPSRRRPAPVSVEPYECCPWCGSDDFQWQNVYVCQDCGRGFVYPAEAKDVRRVAEVKEDED